VSGSLLTLACFAAIACQDARAPKVRRDTSRPIPAVGNHCPVTSHDVRLASTAAGGLAFTLTIAELRLLCPSARLDTVGVGGTSPVALTVAVPGVSISAIQSNYEAYGDSLHQNERPDLWVASGDSLRFPDGTLIPWTVGGFRRLDSAAVIVIDHGDDGTGSYIVRCRYPFLQAIVSNVWPSFADSGIVPFAKVSLGDTTRIWRIEQDPDHPDKRITAACSTAREQPRT
jgi:hypothetical protein